MSVKPVEPRRRRVRWKRDREGQDVRTGSMLFSGSTIARVCVLVMKNSLQRNASPGLPGICASHLMQFVDRKSITFFQSPVVARLADFAASTPRASCDRVDE